MTATEEFQPYAVLNGLPGYLPNSVHHYPTLRDALDAYLVELDKAIETHIEGLEAYDPADPACDPTGLLCFMEHDKEVIERALREHGEPSHPEHDLLTDGYFSNISEYERLAVEPIDPADYHPEEDA